MKIDDEFTAKRNPHGGWELIQTVKTDPNHKKTKNETKEKTTHHATPLQVFQWILDVRLGECEDSQDMIAMLRKTTDWISMKTTEAGLNWLNEEYKEGNKAGYKTGYRMGFGDGERKGKSDKEGK